jgi:uncharacterized membrane protein YeaQ/YmgE (transglycosylase-associated protein family)
MGILSWVVVGLIAGGLARRATHSRRRGCLGTMLVGVLGGLIGGTLLNLATGEKVTHFGIGSILVAFLGACLLLFLLDALEGH